MLLAPTWLDGSMAGKSKSSPRRTTRRPPKLSLPRARVGRRLPPGMVRLDYPRARGYLVRVGYIRHKTGWRPRYQAYFSETRYGGKAKAKAAAEAWLRGLIKTGRPPERAPAEGSRPAPAKRGRRSKRAA